MTDEEILHRVTALEKRIDLLEAFHVRLWKGPITTGPIDGLFTVSTVSCGTNPFPYYKLGEGEYCPSPLHGFSMFHNMTAHPTEERKTF